eukprot:TRINITY_DN15931_c0_g2_i1.p1 TRINITY_DN15931_c0_g2~~TRINITY_DN15931_c0_g2_i1.p1  ORF type:complete len:158 (-),score=27.68 TRINITY_DN15931_c0_g2_i1:25-498(-)
MLSDVVGQTTQVKHAFLLVNRAAKKYNSRTQSNGSLMRLIPLPIFGYHWSVCEVAECAMIDAQMSHPHENCQHANAIYAIAVATLIRLGGNRQAAWEAAWGWANQHASAEVKTWLDEAVAGTPLLCYPQGGYVRIAFSYAFRHLMAGSSYETALRNM